MDIRHELAKILLVFYEDDGVDGLGGPVAINKIQKLYEPQLDKDIEILPKSTRLVRGRVVSRTKGKFETDEPQPDQYGLIPRTPEAEIVYQEFLGRCKVALSDQSSKENE